MLSNVTCQCGLAKKIKKAAAAHKALNSQRQKKPAARARSTVRAIGREPHAPLVIGRVVAAGGAAADGVTEVEGVAEVTALSPAEEKVERVDRGPTELVTTAVTAAWRAGVVRSVYATVTPAAERWRREEACTPVTVQLAAPVAFFTAAQNWVAW